MPVQAAHAIKSNSDTKLIENFKKSAINNAWKALILGHKESAFDLFKYYHQFIDSKETEVVALLFGLVLKYSEELLEIADKRLLSIQEYINEIPESEKPLITDEINSQIIIIIGLINNAPKNILASESNAIVADQIKVFDAAITLPSNNLVSTYFPEQINPFLNLLEGYQEEYLKVIEESNHLVFSHSHDNTELAGREGNQGSYSL